MTAVEWLCNEWLWLDQQFDMCLIDRNIYWDKLRQIQEQAKEMEKEQMIDFAKMHVKIALKAVENEMILQASSVKHWYLPQNIK